MRSLLIICILSLNLGAMAQKSTIKYLSGTGAEDTVNWEFYCTAGNNSGNWTTIKVPSCWEQEGFGQYNYGHVPFKDRLKEEGHYKYQFFAEDNWIRKNIDLVFEGVMTDCEVFLNGKSIGSHQGAFYEFDFDVSKLIKYNAKNMLEIKVKKHSDNQSVNEAERKADYWIFGGIFRPVYLKISPKENIEHLAIDAKANGELLADVTIKNHKKSKLIKVELIDFEGQKHLEFEAPIQKNDSKIRVVGKMEYPKLWSPEFPNRYIAKFSLLDKEGKLIHETSRKIGFRTVEIRESDGIYVNDVKIKFKGVNRHTFHPDYGRTSNEKLSIETVNLIKEMNMNAVRLSHYPQDTHFLNACDSLGLFVLDELAGWQTPCYDTEIGHKLLKEMIRKDVNHPSIILWDNGNENGWNEELDQYFQEYDIQKREVVHPRSLHGKMITSHYIPYNYLSMEHFSNQPIFFPTEFLHGLYDGGAGAGLDDYWKLMWEDPLCAGGFIWVLADESIKRSDNGKLDGDGNHAPDGIVGPYFQKEGSFFTIKQIWSPFHIKKRFISNSFNGEFDIENRYHYTNLNLCSAIYRWKKLPNEIGGKEEILLEGKIDLPELEPMAVGKIKVDLAENWKMADVLEIETKDQYGKELFIWSYPVKRNKNKVQELLVKVKSEYKTKFQEKEDAFEFTNGDIHILIDKATGLLRQVFNSNGELPFSNGPIFLQGDYKAEKVSCRKEENKYFVKVEMGKEADFEWIIDENGRLHLNIEYFKVYHHKNKYSKYWGVDFDLEESDIEKVSWLGNGPYRVWKNRLKGGAFNVWEKEYNNVVTGFGDCEYPEFKGYHSNMYWATLHLKDQQSFKVYFKTDDLYMKLFNPEETAAPAKTHVEHSSGDISFLNGIPAIGTKFKEAEELGPQSQKYTYQSRRNVDRCLKVNLVFDFH